MVLQSALEHYARQQRITAAGLTAARRARGDLRRLTAVVTLFQRLAATDAVNAVDPMLAEQGIEAPPVSQVATAALAGVASDGRPLESLFGQAADEFALDLMIVTQLQDAARVAAGVSIAARPRVGGYVRMLNPPSCPRCAILAGKWFGWNSGFARHPKCDCRHIPTNEDVSGDLRTDPKLAFEKGQIHGLTAAETKAITEGADINQVVNARRSMYVDEAGHRFTFESTTKRGVASGNGPRPTPEQIYRTAGDDRAAAIASLRKFGYLF